MTPDISAPWLPNAYLTQASTSAIAATLWPSTYEMELGATATTYWKPNDWNTLGRYPFSTKIRIENEGEPAPLQPVAFEPVQPYILPSYSPALSSHSRHTSRSVSNESDHAEEHVPPSPMESRSPTVAYESIPSQAGLAKLSNGQWQCAYCLKQFKRRDRGQAHVNVHINARPYRCDGSCGNPVCDRSYFSQESLQSHAQHAMIICETCGKELRKKNISRHRKRYCNSKPSP